MDFHENNQNKHYYLANDKKIFLMKIYHVNKHLN